VVTLVASPTLPGFAAGPGGPRALSRLARTRVARQAGEAVIPPRAIGSVGREPNPGSLGRWISSRIDERHGHGENVHLHAFGNRIYPAMKAVVIASENLKEKGQLVALSEWGERKVEDKRFVTADLTFSFMPAAFSWDPEAVALKAGKDTDIGNLAGAIAAQLRETGQSFVIGVGGVPVNKAMKAVIVSQQYLREENPEAKVGVVPGYKRDMPRPDSDETMTAFTLRVAKL